MNSSALLVSLLALELMDIDKKYFWPSFIQYL